VTGDRRPRDISGSKQRPLSPAAAPVAAGLVPLPRGAPDKRGPERLEGRGTRGLFPALRGSEVRSARGDTRPQFPARCGGAWCRRPASTKESIKERPNCTVTGVRIERQISYNCDGTAALTPLSGSRLPRSAGLSVILLPCGGGVRMAGAPFSSCRRLGHAGGQRRDEKGQEEGRPGLTGRTWAALFAIVAGRVARTRRLAARQLPDSASDTGSGTAVAVDAAPGTAEGTAAAARGSRARTAGTIRR
jgi:hypothetical protein